MITRRASFVTLLALTAVWLVAQSCLLPPIAVAEHWRQAETASMALNLAHREFDPFFPQINWGGDGPGYVEAEFPLYQALVAALMLVFGDSPWTGMAVSLACIAACAVAVCALVGRRFGAAAGLVAGAYVLTSRLGVHLSAAVMPDALAVLLYVVALERFLAWIQGRRTSALLWSAAALALSACIKPTALGLGVAEFGIVIVSARDALRRPWVWLAWAGVLAVCAAWLLHAAHLHAVWGNSFGVIAGGDSKFPLLAQVFDRDHLYALGRVSLEWGIGGVPLLFGLGLLLWRRWGPIEWSLAIANVLVLIVSLRYATLDYAGGHYHVFAMILAAWFVAKAYALVDRGLREGAVARRMLMVAAAVALCAAYGRNVTARRREDREQVPAAIVELGRTLATRVTPDTLVVAQSDDDAWDPAWQRADNYQDPRLFYASHTRGWVLPHDVADATTLADFAARGAEYYVVAGPPPAALEPWLAEHARVVYRDRFGSIFELPTGGHDPAAAAAAP